MTLGGNCHGLFQAWIHTYFLLQAPAPSPTVDASEIRRSPPDMYETLQITEIFTISTGAGCPSTVILKHVGNVILDLTLMARSSRERFCEGESAEVEPRK